MELQTDFISEKNDPVQEGKPAKETCHTIRLPRWLSGEESACKARDGSNPWSGKFPWRRKWQPTPVFLPREPHGQYGKTKNMILEDEPLGSEGVWYATGEEWRAVTSSSGKNEMIGPKRKQSSVFMCLVVKVKSNAVKNIA